MSVPITGLYAGIIAIFALYLSFQAGTMRGRVGISLFHGDNMELGEKVRRHQNLTEYVPFILILMGVLELNGSSAMLLNIAGVAMILFRVAHAQGLHHDNIGHPLRAVGAAGTALLTLVLAGLAIWKSAAAMLG